MLFLFFVWFPILISCSSFQLDLSGEWKFSSKNKSITGIGVIPGDIFSDLYRNRIIENPLFGDNHLKFQWVAEDDWTYSREFSIENSNNYSHALLHIGELDTIAVVSINNKTILHSQNQFIEHNVDISKYLRSGINIISIEFSSPTKFATQLADEFEYFNNHELPPVCPPSIYHGDCHPNFIRKAQYSFSWDWGPSFPTVGVPGDIFINFFDLHFFDDFTWTTELIDDFWYVNIEFFSLHYGIETDIRFIVEISDLVKPFSLTYRTDRNLGAHNHKVIGTYKLDIESKKVEKWWPNGMGGQHLYEIRVVSCGKEIRKQIGFKTVELVQSFINPKIPKLGRNFYFKVNNVPIFLKGSNWIPVSMFRNFTSNTNKMEFLLDSAADVGMNILRVWGGGFYESEEFYNYAAEKGILIWQDMMFACALYPTDKNFLTNVRSEIESQVTRLKKHPSILVYAGNNENEAAIRGHWWKVSNYSENQQVRDYVKLYSQIAKIVTKIDSTKPFVMSSPSNGIETEEEGGVSKNPYDVRYGDIHFYNEFVNLWRDDSFVTPRCATEYGIQSFPLRETMLKWINESDWEYTSQTMFHRQHHPGGIAFNLLMIFSHLPIPDQCPSKSLVDLHKCEYLTSNKYMSRLAYFSQIHQATALKTQTFHYRRFRNLTNAEGLGNTMCAMYWQLNDVWAAPTWSTIDFEQQWKMSHYEVRRMFSNLAVYLYIDPADFNLKPVIINDDFSEILNTTMRLQQLSWESGLDPVFSQEYPIERIHPTTAQEVDLSLNAIEYSELSEYLYVVQIYNAQNQILASDVLLPNFLFEINFSTFGKVRIENMRKQNAGLYEILLSTDRISPFTWVSCSKQFSGWFSDNGFHMTGRTKTIELVLKEEMNLSINDFSVCNLRNCYL